MLLELFAIIALTVGLLAVTATIAADVGRRRARRAANPASWLDDVARRRLLVQTTDGQTLEGSLVRVDADGIALASPRLDATALSGDLWVPRERIAWVQRPSQDAPSV